MKKVTIFSLHLGYGGIEKCVVNLANLLVDNYDVEIVSTYKLDDVPAFEVDDRVKIKYLITKYKPNREEWKESLKKFKLITFIKESFKSVVLLVNRKRKTIEAMRKCNSDIAISTRDLFNKWMGANINNKVYKIAWEHNHHHNNIEYAKKVVNSCKNIDTLVLVSDSLRNYYKKMMKDENYKCKCVFIPNMLDYVPRVPSKLKNNNLIAVGRFSKEKGFLDLIEVINELRNKYPKFLFHLDLIGDGAEKNKIVDKVYEYKLNDYIKVHGYLKKKELNKLLNVSSIYLMTSFTESFGIVLIEAMSHGLPCISYTSAEGANELITNDYNGYLIENRNIDEMIDKIMYLFNNEEKMKELGKNAREFSLNYTSDNIKKEWLDLLKRKV